MIREGKLRWISSAGGPLVVLQQSTLSSWGGALGGDYDRAGAIRGYIGIIKQGELDAIVLWGEPLETAYYAGAKGQFLVRWSYGPDDTAVLNSLDRMHAAAMSVSEDLVVEVVDDRQFIIDAAAPGYDAEEQVPLSLTPGRYVIASGIYRPSPEIEMIVHPLLAC